MRSLYNNREGRRRLMGAGYDSDEVSSSCLDILGDAFIGFHDELRR